MSVRETLDGYQYRLFENFNINRGCEIFWFFYAAFQLGFENDPWN